MADPRDKPEDDGAWSGFRRDVSAAKNARKGHRQTVATIDDALVL